MDRGANEHLSVTALAELAEAVRRRGPSIPRAEDVDPHLAVCSACRDQFEEHVLLDRQLQQLKSSEPALHQADCPDSALWREIAAGVTPPKQVLAHLQHASRCDHCGPLLREAVAEVTNLNQATTEAERAEIATLASAQPERQRDIARRMAGTTRRDPAPAPWWKVWANVPRLAIAGAALAAVVAAASWITVHSRNSSSAGQLLAHAYTEQRTLEVRFAGAAYAPLRVQRGPEASFADRTPSLLKAEALIASELPSHPTDPSWLQAKGRADLLEGKYDAAVESLRRALELSPDSPELMVDVASAYFQRALTEDRPQDYGAAFESLSKALAKQPDDPVALFNRAIVSEHQFLYHQALEDWEHYLRVDPRSQWADEARVHADTVRSKLEKHTSQATPLMTPAQLVDPANDATRRSAVDERIEEYLQDAVRLWLPSAYPEKASQADPAARQALFFLADLTTEQHNDRWLSDFLSGSSSPNFPQAVAALARAVKANEAAEFDTSRQQATQAERLFRSSGNVAGILRAQFEQTFAAQITRHSEDCRRQAIASLAESEKYSYPWLHIQLGLEQGVCSVLMGDLGTYERVARRAQGGAQQVGYGARYLRALAFVANSKFLAGNLPVGWKLVCTGLEHYWLGRFPAMQGYNLYGIAAYAAGDAGQSNLQVAIWREAVAIIDANEDLLLRASANSNMAAAANAAHQPEVAEQQYAEAARLYALAPQTEAIRADRLENEIRNAQLEALSFAFDAALARLTRAQDEVRQLSNNYLAQIFYSTLGEVQLRSHHAAEAEQAFRPALALAEQKLASLGSEVERINWRKDAAPVYLGMVEAELVQGHTQESLDLFERYLGAPQRLGQRHRHQAISADPDPSWLTSQLPLLSRKTVLAYGALPDGLAIWICDDRGVNAQWISQANEDLPEMAARLYDLSSKPRSELSALRRDARSLYRALIAPVEQRLVPSRTLVIEAAGWPERVPFEALLDSSDHYLIERTPIVHSLGQYSDAQMHSESSISPDLQALVVGSTASSQGLIPLPDVAAEADTVAAGFRSPRVLKGPDATLSGVKRELTAAAVFHFVGHSLATPNGAGLMLGAAGARQDSSGLLAADAFRHLDLRNMEMVVLSTCNTESGSDGSRGFNSVAEALQRSGVPHVVASRWAVDSVETRGFVEDFYHNVLSGQPVSAALRQSARNMLANPRTAHPYYWAAFSAYGLP